MTVKEVKSRIEELEKCRDNILKLQDYFLGHGTSPQEKIDEVKSELEEGANLNTPIRQLCSVTGGFLVDEIKRLESIIDNAVVKLN